MKMPRFRGRSEAAAPQISPETQEVLDRPLFDMTPEAYADALNSFIEQFSD
jgi:hypothetical protein